MSTFHFGPGTISIGSSDSSPRITDQHILNEIEARAKDNPELAKQIKDLAEYAENAHRARIEKALAGSAELELLKDPPGKRFVLALLQNGTVEISHGIDYAYGQIIKEDDLCAEKRVFVAGHLVGCGTHYSMKQLRNTLDIRGFIYHIEYIK